MIKNIIEDINFNNNPECHDLECSGTFEIDTSLCQCGIVKAPCWYCENNWVVCNECGYGIAFNFYMKGKFRCLN